MSFPSGTVRTTELHAVRYEGKDASTALDIGNRTGDTSAININTNAANTRTLNIGSAGSTTAFLGTVTGLDAIEHTRIVDVAKGANATDDLAVGFERHVASVALDIDVDATDTIAASPAPTLTSCTLTTSTAADAYWVNAVVTNTTSGESRRVTGWTLSTKALTFAAFATLPVAGQTMQLRHALTPSLLFDESADGFALCYLRDLADLTETITRYADVRVEDLVAEDVNTVSMTASGTVGINDLNVTTNIDTATMTATGTVGVNHLNATTLQTTGLATLDSASITTLTGITTLTVSGTAGINDLDVTTNIDTATLVATGAASALSLAATNAVTAGTQVRSNGGLFADADSNGAGFIYMGDSGNETTADAWRFRHTAGTLYVENRNGGTWNIISEFVRP